jgi:hypothetical protein
MSPERTQQGMDAILEALALNSRQARDLLNRTPEPDSVLEHFDAIYRLLADPTRENIREAREQARHGYTRARRVYADNHQEGGCGRDLATVFSKPRYGVQEVAGLLRPHLATLRQPFRSPFTYAKAERAISEVVADVSDAGKGEMFSPNRAGLRHELGVGPYMRLRSLLDAPSEVAA